MSERDDFDDTAHFEPADSVEDGLRRLFADDRLTLPTAPGATARVVAAARRARKRREFAVVGGGTLVAASALVAVVLVAMQPGTGGSPVAAPPIETTLSSALLSEAPPTQTSAPRAIEPSVEKKTTVPTQPTSGSGSQTSESSAPPPEEIPMLSGGPIGPDGYRDLRLGMSFEDAKPYLADEDKQPPSGCTSYELAEGNEWVSTVVFSESGLARINASGGGRTPENMGAGSTLDELEQAYPEGTTTESGDGFHAATGSGGIYQFTLSQNNATSMSLSDGGSC